jgi:hypothetical protein
MSLLFVSVLILLIEFSPEFTHKDIIKFVTLSVGATAVVTMKLIIDNRKKKVRFVQALASWFISMVSGYIMFPIIEYHIQQPYTYGVFSLWVLFSEKSLTLIIDNSEEIVKSVLNKLWERLLTLFK